MDSIHQESIPSPLRKTYQTDLVGCVFGRLSVLNCVGTDKYGKRLWRCVCIWGTEKIVQRGDLISSRVQSCGCLKRETFTAPEDIAGRVFGRLSVLEYVGSNKYGKRLWRCICACGKEIVVLRGGLTSGKTQSCGCIQKEIASHRMRNLPKRPPRNLVGQKFGKWVVVEDKGKSVSRNRLFLCRCECGKEYVVQYANLMYYDFPKCRDCSYTDRRYTSDALAIGAEKTLFLQYHWAAESRHYEFVLTSDEFHLLVQGECYYCGSLPSQKVSAGSRYEEVYLYNGIDRIDNEIGYVSSNVRSCCKRCNIAKLNSLETDFYIWIGRVWNYLFLREPDDTVNILTPNTFSPSFSATIYRRYKYAATRRGLEFSLSEKILYLLTQSPCGYCGRPPTLHSIGIYTGIDRIDNTCGYTVENVRPCCRQCNVAKGGLTEQQFFDWIRGVYAHLANLWCVLPFNQKYKPATAWEYKTYCGKGHEFTPKNTYVLPQGRRRCIACYMARRCKHGHEFTEENTFVKPNGSRGCRECSRRTSRQFWRDRHGKA